MYWVLHIVGRDVRGRTNYTCIKIRILYTFVLFSPEGYSSALV